MSDPAIAPASTFAATAARFLGFAPPAECADGIAANLALLEDHARILNAFLAPDGEAK